MNGFCDYNYSYGKCQKLASVKIVLDKEYELCEKHLKGWAKHLLKFKPKEAKKK